MPEANTQTRAVEPLDEVLANVVHLYVRRRRGLLMQTENNSTGVVIEGQYVLTAAHNVYTTFLSKVKSISVSIGKASVDGRDTMSVYHSRVARGYDWKMFKRDFAVLKLPQPVATAKPFKLVAVASADDVAGQLHLAGYPGASGGERNGKNLFTGTGTATYSAGSEILDYDVDTETGNSGGPVWIADAEGNPRAVGAHVTELHGNHGRARLANQDMVDEVHRMIDSLG